MEEVAQLKISATILTARNISNGSRPRYRRQSLRGISDAARAGPSPYGPDTVPVRSFNYVEEVKARITKNTSGQTPRSPLPPIWEELCE